MLTANSENMQYVCGQWMSDYHLLAISQTTNVMHRRLAST